jgi:hypothetical protein
MGIAELEPPWRNNGNHVHTPKGTPAPLGVGAFPIHRSSQREFEQKETKIAKKWIPLDQEGPVIAML